MIIYKITNLVNNKIYIGQTIRTLEARWRKHWVVAKLGKWYISNALRKYGKENFKIEEIYKANNQHELNEAEKFFANLFDSYAPNGYNIKECGQSHGKMHQTTIDKISKSYTFVSPNGDIIHFKNLAKFCRENNLCSAHMSGVATGQRKSHKGWHLESTKKEDLYKYKNGYLHKYK